MGNKDTYLIDLYLTELEHIKPISSEEERELLNSFRENKNSRDRLIEGNLKSSLMILKDYVNMGVSIEDVLGELNLALINAIDAYKEGDFKEYINSYIKEYIEEYIKNEKEQENGIKELSMQMNIMSDTASNLAKEYGREASVEEIAKAMNLDVSKVRAMMKMTMDVIS